MKIIFLFIRFILFIPLLLIFGLPSYGQQPVLNKVSPPAEINWEAITGLSQDQQGFLWLASVDGLHRYDGTRFVSYYHHADDDNSIAADRLESIFISKSGIIWIGTFEKGLDRFDPNTKIFTHFSHNPKDSTSLNNNTVTAILEDAQGILWVGTHGGLHRFHPESGTFTRYQHNPKDPTSLSHDKVRVLYLDKQETLWIGTGSPWESKPGEGGLNKFNPENSSFTRYMNSSMDSKSILENRITALFEDSRGTFWVGTYNGLRTMDREKGTFTSHQYDPENPEKLSPAPNFRGNPAHISFVHEDVTGAIWIGNCFNGLSRYEPITEKVQHFAARTQNPNGLKNNDLWKAQSTREGVIWMTTLSGDLYRADPLAVSISHHLTDGVVNTLVEDNFGIVWTGTENGLKLYDLHTGKIQKPEEVLSFPPPLTRDPVNALLVDRKFNIWIGGNEVWQYDITNQTYKSYPFEPKGAEEAGQYVVYVLYEDREGMLWAGTSQGLFQLNPKTHSITAFTHDPQNPQSLSNNKVYTLHEDHLSNIWVGTAAGVNILNRKTGKFKRHLANNRQTIFSILEDGSNTLLIGSLYHGLYTYDQQKDEVVRFKDKQTGVINRTRVLGMVRDDHANVWVSTVSGLDKIDKSGKIVATYGVEMGLNSGAFTGVTYKGRQGNLYFFDTTGFYTFNPKDMKHNLHPPQVELTGVRLFDEPVVLGKLGPWAMPVGKKEEIRFNHKQNVFTFEFVAIHFTNPEQNQQFFMLENYDTDWRPANGLHSAAYYKVPPGNYEFRVKAASSEGVWAEKSIAVTVLPPWWRTWWAYGCYGLMGAMVIFAVDRTQRRKILHRERERTREEKLAQAKEIEKAYGELGKAHQTLKSTQAQLIQSEKMASLGELTAGIAHEIQNPLNFVNNFSEVSAELVDEIKETRAKSQESRPKTEEDEIEDEILEDIKQNLEKINHHGKRADAIVKGMLEHSRTSPGEKVLTDINALADEYLRLSYHGMRARDKSFNADFITDFDPNLPKISVVSQDIGRVLLNIINNAFQATHELSKGSEPWESFKPRVTVTTKKREGSPSGLSRDLGRAGGSERTWVEISVQDNGPGIPSSIKDKIFQPFFTTKPAGQGTGLGLSLSYDIVKAHSGELKVKSKEGEGSEFIINLPA
ncbi:two-component regulator propeller domain-containing protein [Aquiflexum lacus]|uniref:two-component regulator propeller domain-containing protein n=1 Tax=Aquiflexum lacus TaxID=2483805 RepID=UPI0018932ABD|nr:two-component regulator propeller domain-containing protein [Aquiflexum lacus]